MKNVLLFLLLFAISFSLFSQEFPDPLMEAASDEIGFVSNAGQVTDESGNVVSPSSVYYHSVRTLPFSFYLANKTSFVFPKIDRDTSTKDTFTRLDMTWIYSDVGNSVNPIAFEQTDEIHNFYYEHCTSGCDGLNKYKGLLYENIYDGVDLRIYSNTQWLKYYFIIKPGTNPETLHIKFDGFDNLTVDTNILALRIGNIDLFLPSGIAYEYSGGTPNLLGWTPQFVLQTDGSILMTSGGNSYNTAKNLVYEIMIPVTTGGSTDLKNIDKSIFPSVGKEYWNISQDNSGNPHVCGWTNYRPILPNATNNNIVPSGGASTRDDFLLLKFNSSDLSLNWVTYYGGAGNEGSWRYGLALDSYNKTYMFGSTQSDGNGSGAIPLNRSSFSSSHWDVSNPSSNGQVSYMFDNVLAKFGTTGSLEFATFLGDDNPSGWVAWGWGGDISGQSSINIDKDDGDRIYVAGLDNIDYALHDPNPGNDYFHNVGSNFIAAISANNMAIQWCTYFGTNSQYAGWTIINNMDIVGHNLTITGRTKDATNFPKVSGGNYTSLNGTTGYGNNSTDNGGGYDHFITRFDVSFKVIWSTYLGGSDVEEATRIHHTNSNKIILTGYTNSNWNSITDEGFHCNKTTIPGKSVFNSSVFLGGGIGDAFINVFKESGSTYQSWNSTYLAEPSGSYGDVGSGIASNSTTDDIFVLGYTEGNYAAATNQPSFLYSQSNSGQLDGFITAFNSDFEMKWSTNLGGSLDDKIYDSKCIGSYLYVIGNSSSSDFPIKPAKPKINNNYEPYIMRFALGSTPLGVNKIKNGPDNKLVLFPNPSSNKLFFEIDNKINSRYLSAKIFDCLGSIVKTINVKSEIENSIDISDIANGVYFIQIVDSNGILYSNKFIKQ